MWNGPRWPLIGVFAISSPAVYLGVLGVLEGGDWNIAALLVGVAIGLVAVVGGVLLGGMIFDRRAPELLAFTSRY